LKLTVVFLVFADVTKWHGNLDQVVNAPLSWFHSRNRKSNSKEKANSRFLHASYTFSMIKKNLLIGGWVGVSQLLVAARHAAV
jgi:thiamine phosphate synthase YjbQ (UPF0047 family)